jgi:DNA-binding CsgD family transcriptional regulator
MVLVLWLINFFSVFSSFGVIVCLVLVYARFKNKGILYLLIAVVMLSLVYLSGIVQLIQQTEMGIPSAREYFYSIRPSIPSQVFETILLGVLCFSFPFSAYVFMGARRGLRIIILNLIVLLVLSAIYIVLISILSVSFTVRAIVLFIRMVPYIVALEFACFLVLRNADNIWFGIKKLTVIYTKIFAYILIPAMLLEDIVYFTVDLSFYNLVEAASFFILVLSILHIGILFALQYPRSVAKYENVGVFAREFRLTGREEEVCSFLVRGASYKDIGHSLNISIDTVKTHVKNIYQKTNCSGKYDLKYKIADNQAK